MLVLLTFAVAFPDLTSLAVADGYGHRVTPFTAVELDDDAAELCFVVDIVQYIGRF